jgi:GNAT superfamily N-acetyltransferase
MIQVGLKELDLETVGDINSMDGSFEVASRIVPRIENGVFVFDVEEAKGLQPKTDPDDVEEYATYVKNPDKVPYLAYVDHQAVGQIILKKWWNRFAWVEDIRVESTYRRRGIGAKLMDAAISWARRTGYPGIMLETQDTRVPACLFYQAYGFVFGGADEMLYTATESSGETALFWYLVF